MIIAYLNDLELPALGVPLTETTIENATDIVTADNNVYTTFAVSSNKRGWTIRFDLLREDDYNQIKAIYDDQWINYQYPTLSIPYYNIEDIPVRMSISPKEIFNHCGDVQDVIINLRESVQLSGSGSS